VARTNPVGTGFWGGKRNHKGKRIKNYDTQENIRAISFQEREGIAVSIPVIHIQDILSFSGHGIEIHPEALNRSGEEIKAAIKQAFDHSSNRLLQDAWRGGCGPLAKYSSLELDEYLKLCEQIANEERIRKATKKQKKILSHNRRREFDSKRAQIVLEMLDRGDPYVCAEAGCDEVENLTVDHIIPLSKGGGDELSNLRFMCLRHNAMKGDGIGAGEYRRECEDDY
jgi:hypothetical protein